jgi:hypothetical protein
MAALKRSKTGGYSARKVIPKDVRDPYTRLHGVAWEAKLSIPANTPLHEAKRLHGEWIADVETQIGALRAVAKGEGQPLTKLNAVALAGRWYVWFVAEYEGDPGSPKRWSEPIDSYIWDHLSIHAPAEYHEDPGADPHWLWAREPEVREAVRPTVAEMARTVSFLAKEGIVLNSEANNLFVDEVSDHLFAAFKLLEKRAWGDYTPDETPKKFPQGSREGKGGGTTSRNRRTLGQLSVIGPELSVPSVVIKPHSIQGYCVLTRLSDVRPV